MSLHPLLNVELKPGRDYGLTGVPNNFEDSMQRSAQFAQDHRRRLSCVIQLRHGRFEFNAPRVRRRKDTRSIGADFFQEVLQVSRVNLAGVVMLSHNARVIADISDIPDCNCACVLYDDSGGFFLFDLREAKTLSSHPSLVQSNRPPQDLISDLVQNRGYAGAR